MLNTSKTRTYLYSTLVLMWLFGGFHWNNPREVYVELRYRFRY